MLIYSSKLRFLACFCLVSAASPTFFNGLLLIDAIGCAPHARRCEPPAALTHQSAMALYLACADE